MATRRTERVSKRAKERRDSAPARHLSDAATAAPSQQVWRGASGALYAHTVTSLLFCPEMPEATYVLVHRDAAGTARVLRVGTLDNKARSLNLARIRQLGATLGANEVHVRVERASAAERARIAFDIESALAGGTPQLEATVCGAPQLA
ncbi:MAG: hypothetical protein ACK4TL_15760 [Hyphomicrobiaceae bacterium]